MVDLRSEGRAIALFVVALVFASTLPYLAAWRATPDGRQYAGTTEASSDDYPTYLAKMRAGARRELFYRSPYAPELDSTLTIRPLYGTIGAVTGALGLPFWFGYHAARLLLGALSLLAIFLVARAVARSRSETWAAALLAAVGSGVGWLVGREAARADWSYDLWVPELNGWHALLTNPHFPLATILMLAAFWGVARSLEEGRLRPAAAGGAACALLAIVHPYDVVIVAAVLVLFGISGVLAGRTTPPRLLRAGLIFSGAALPGLAWIVASAVGDPALAHMRQGQEVGGALMIIAGAGLLLPLAAWGWRPLWRRNLLGAVLATWAATVPLLLILPLPFARRMVASWHLPLGLAAGLALSRLVAGLRSPAARRLAVAAAVVLLAASNLDILSYQVRLFSSPRPGVLTSLPRDLLAAYRWLESQAPPRSIVLAPYAASNWLPAYTDLSPYYGHWAEAPAAEERRQRVDRFYRGGDGEAEQAAFLRRVGVDWILYGDVGLGGYPRLDLNRIPGVKPVHRIGGVEIYLVTREGAAEN
jgi:hypothetical protein